MSLEKLNSEHWNFLFKQEKMRNEFYLFSENKVKSEQKKILY